MVSQAVVVAGGAAAAGRRGVLGFGVGDTESQPFWTACPRSLKVRGLDGVKLVFSDAHTGLIAAIETVFQGSSWQRCRVHFMRNVLANVRMTAGPMVASIIRTIFAQPDAEHVGTEFDEVVRMLEAARDDKLSFTGFPVARWRQIWSTNPLERVNKEIKRRTDVAGTFPNPAALLRLAGLVLIEQHDEWGGVDRRYFNEHSMKLLDVKGEEVAIPELSAA